MHQLDTLISTLDARGDARAEWWKRMRVALTLADYSIALRMLLDHRDDADFAMQVQIVAGTIYINRANHGR